MVGMLKETLTSPYTPEMKVRLSHTWPGQASFADPSIGKSCRECLFWGRKSFDRDKWGKLLPKRCYKRASLIRGLLADPVPCDAFACRMFEAGENRPLAERPKKSGLNDD